MEYKFTNLKSLVLEITTYCNAACPQCPRNNHGGKTVDDLPLVSWTLQDFQKTLTADFISQLDSIYFSGTYGDPMFNKHLVDMCEWIRFCHPSIKIGINTNGSLGKKDSYVKLASLVDFIAFGIDGLEDTNHIYRRNVDWKKLISNVSSFVTAGGVAYWDFIVFKHNQHQVEEARQLSHSLGFAQFNIKKTSRFFDKEHKLTTGLTVLDLDSNPLYVIEPPSDPKYYNNNYKILSEIDLQYHVKSTKITCYNLEHNIIYIGADGFVFPCGWLHDRFYGVETANTNDYILIRNMMKSVGGPDIANCFHTSLQDIVDGPWFRCIQNSWHKQRLERCALICGEKINLIKEQNEFINYKS